MAATPIAKVLDRYVFKDTKTEFKSEASTHDEVGNLYFLASILSNNVTKLRVRKWSYPAFVQLGEWFVTPAENQKADGISIQAVGRDLICHPIAHSPTPGDVDPNRNSTEQVIIFPGICDVKEDAEGYVPTPMPCVPPTNLPYLQPGAPIRRDQALLMLFRVVRWLSKKLGFGLVIPGMQKFQDVAPPLPGQKATELYEAAQWAGDAGIISGYKCTSTEG